MKNRKRFMSLLLSAVMLLAVAPAAWAASFTDVASGAWYTDAVNYVDQNNLMDPADGSHFAPDADASRIALAVALYRAAGSPAAAAEPFTDIPADSQYAGAAAWARANGVIVGHDDGRFGVDEPVTREQLVAILWRHAGSPAAEQGQNFTDEAAISDYAAQAVDWSQANGVISGHEDGRFGPQEHTTRAQLAVILRGYLSANPPSAPSTRTLVAYFSGSGNTRAVARTVADTLNADLFEITPVTPYTSADLDWTAPGSRVNREHDDEGLRDIPLVTTTPDNWAEYDTVLIGYPIWWGIAAWPVDNFVKSNDFTGKRVVPFATSTSSGIGQSGQLLAELAGTGDWQDGQRFRERPAQADVQRWADGLGL